MFWIGCVTPVPLIVSVELLLAGFEIVASPILFANFNCLTSAFTSKITDVALIVAATVEVGTPSLQFAALDQRLFPPAFVNSLEPATFR